MKIPLEYPYRGLSDNVGFSKQPAQTSEVLLNERVIDPKTGRMRGAQRAGLSKFNSNALSGSNPIRHLTSFTRAENLITYKDKTSGGSSGSDDDATFDPIFQAKTEKKGPARAMVSDRQSNVYVTDGNSSIEKLSADLESIWRLEVPVNQRQDVVRALDVDDDGNVYIGVSTGSDSREALLFRYEQQLVDEDDACKKSAEPVKQRWKVKPGRWIERLVVRRGFLYTIQNDPRINAAFLVIYDSLNSSEPDVFIEREVPHPANDIDVGLDGSIYVASDANADRGINPQVRGFQAKAIDWTPEDLTDATERIYSWLRAEDLVNILGLEDDDAVTFWPDYTGKGRSLFEPTGGTAPTLLKLGIAGLPSVHFNRPDQQSLESATNAETEDNFVDQMRTLIPGNVSGTWSIHMVVRTPREEGAGCILMQKNDSDDPGNVDFVIAANAGSEGAFGSEAPGDLTAQGSVGCWIRTDSTNPAHGDTIATSEHQPRGSNSTSNADASDPASYDPPTAFEGIGTDSRTFIVSFVNNSTDDESVWRVNGVPMDVFDTEAWSCTEATRVGENAGVTPHVADYLQGDISEIIVIHESEGGASAVTIPGDTDTADGGPFNYPDHEYDAANTTDPTEVEQIEGYLAWKYGIHNELPDSTTGAGLFPHPYHTDNGPPKSIEDGASEGDLLATTTMLSKFDGNTAELKWVLADNAGNQRGGLGYGVRAACNGNVWSVGPAGTSEDITVRYIIDTGDGFDTDDTGSAPPVSTATADGAVSVDFGGAVQTYKYPYTAVDRFNNFYVAFDSSNGTVGDINTNTLYVFSNTGVALHSILFADTLPVDSTREIQWGRAVALNPIIPDYQGDLDNDGSADNQRAEMVFVGTTEVEFDEITAATWTGMSLTITKTGAFTNWEWFEGAVIHHTAGTAGPGTATQYEIASKTDDDNIVLVAGTPVGTDGSDMEFDLQLNPKDVDTIHKVRLVDADDNTSGATREQVNLGVCDGDLVKFADSGVPSVVGNGIFNTSAKLVQSAEVRGQMFFTDGIGDYYVYRKIKDEATDEVVKVQAKFGSIPPRCKLMATYLGRLVLAGDPNEPHNWYMSSAVNAYDFDFYPPEPTATQAVAGNTPVRAGLSPDIVTALIPAKDDVLLIGGDRSINAMVGDPAAGGQIVAISETRGIAFGSPWTKDPEERVYFFGSRGGVYVVAPQAGATPMRLSVDFIERRLQDIDFSTHRIEMEWDWRREGLFIAQVPYGAVGTLVRSWFWEQKSNSWHEDQYGNSDFTSVQPTSIAVLDGDDVSDRILVFGCEDGIVRKVDEDAENDDVDGSGDPVPIYSRARMGPFAVKGAKRVRMTAFWPQLAFDQQGCKFHVYISDSADRPGDPIKSGTLKAGNNGRVSARGRGSYVWLELYNAAINERWAWENCTVEVFEVGRSRVGG